MCFLLFTNTNSFSLTDISSKDEVVPVNGIDSPKPVELRAGMYTSVPVVQEIFTIFIAGNKRLFFLDISSYVCSAECGDLVQCKSSMIIL